MALFPPDTNNLDAIAAFFASVDSLALVKDVNELPQAEFPREPDLIRGSVRLLKEDVEIIKRMPYTTWMRGMHHRLADGLQGERADANS